MTCSNYDSITKEGVTGIRRSKITDLILSGVVRNEGKAEAR